MPAKDELWDELTWVLFRVVVALAVMCFVWWWWRRESIEWLFEVGEDEYFPRGEGEVIVEVDGNSDVIVNDTCLTAEAPEFKMSIAKLYASSLSGHCL